MLKTFLILALVALCLSQTTLKGTKIEPKFQGKIDMTLNLTAPHLVGLDLDGRLIKYSTLEKQTKIVSKDSFLYATAFDGAIIAAKKDSFAIFGRDDQQTVSLHQEFSST